MNEFDYDRLWLWVSLMNELASSPNLTDIILWWNKPTPFILSIDANNLLYAPYPPPPPPPLFSFFLFSFFSFFSFLSFLKILFLLLFVQRHAEQGVVRGVDEAVPGADRRNQDECPASDRLLPAPHDLPGGSQRPGCGLAERVPHDRGAVRKFRHLFLRCHRPAGRLPGCWAGCAVVDFTTTTTKQHLTTTTTTKSLGSILSGLGLGQRKERNVSLCGGGQ